MAIPLLESFVEPTVTRLGESMSLALTGLLVGVAFGFLAQRSRFCLRSAVLEFARKLTGGKLTVWLFAFATAVLATQALAWAGAYWHWSRRCLAVRRRLARRRHRVGAPSAGRDLGLGRRGGCRSDHSGSLVGNPRHLESVVRPAARAVVELHRAFLVAALFGELKPESFQGGASMHRYIIGAMCMGFGGMLAGGCAVGAGLSGAAVFTITAYVTLTAMWVAAAVTDRVLGQHPTGVLDQPMPSGIRPA